MRSFAVLIALMALLNAGVAVSAQRILDTQVPEEVSSPTYVEDFGVTLAAPMR